MRDGVGRMIDYIRISVTDRCNFRCRYCMPSAGFSFLEPAEILSYEELLRVLNILGRHGVNKVRLTGGEPLVRKGIVDFIREIRALGTMIDISMTTNGSLLGDVAHQLKDAGLDRINISIDTLDEERFTRITGTGRISDTLNGIRSALDAGLSPVKLNVVLTEVLSDEDISYFVEQVNKYPVIVRFIEYMPIGHCEIRPGPGMADIKSRISAAGYGPLEKTLSVRGNGPAKYYRLPRSPGMFGFVAAISEHFCHTCNRLRLTADGKIKPCLLANQEIDIKTALRDGSTDEFLYKLILKAVRVKPSGHRLGEVQGGVTITRDMFKTGG
ncbi:MAG: GTP 3',8-cyclase MoaA [Bacillota bacterium]|nr:GTP 3',8-cyclase MoaA [Bacillota bacterium]